MKISGAILCSPGDDKNARVLNDALGGFAVVHDCVGLDGVSTAWSPSGSHHCVIKGDSRISPRLMRRMAEAVELLPDVAISFFAGWDEPNGSAVRLAAAGKHSWVEGIQVDYVSTQALLLPARHADTFAHFASNSGKTQPDYDAALFDYLQLADLPIYLSVPSLVDSGARAAWFADSVGGNSVLSGYRYCPYFTKGLSYGMNRYGDEMNHTWCHEHWSVAATRLGLSPDHVLAGFNGHLAKASWSDHERTYLTSMWVTSYLVGALGEGEAGDLEPALLDSLLLGGRNGMEVNRDTFAGREDDLMELARAAYATGRGALRGGVK